MSLVDSVPRDWKTNVKFENVNIPRELNVLDTLLKVKHTNKFIYNIFMKKDIVEDKKSKIKWNTSFLNEDLNWKTIYITPLKSTTDIKLRNFQYKFLHRTVPTNQFLAKCNLVSSSLCDFCGMEIETINHLFWECMYVQSFWMELTSLLNQNNIHIEINLKHITFGVCQLIDKQETQINNFIIFIAKYFIFASKYRKEIPVLQAFKPYLHKRVKIEKEIAFMKDRLAQFENKWRNFLDIFI